MQARTAQPARPLPPKPVQVAPARAVCVRWTVAREALGSRLPQRAGGHDVILELTATPSPDGWVCRACLIDGPVTTPVETTPAGATAGGWTSDAETGLDHLDLPGFLHATLRGEVTLYGRTPLLSALGAAGGRYEVVRLGE